MPEDMDAGAPTGCLGCNPEPVRAFLLQRGIALERFKEVPPPRHNWGDVTICQACGRAWLQLPAPQVPPPRRVSMNVPPPDDRTLGLYEKFRVERRDGSSGPGGKHERCEYYVLDLAHDQHAWPALIAYAACCEKEFPQLAEDLRKKVAALYNARGSTPKETGNEGLTEGLVKKGGLNARPTTPPPPPPKGQGGRAVAWKPAPDEGRPAQGGGHE